MIAVELRSLCKSFKASPVIDHLSLRIEAGEMIALLGAGGAGKTTLLDMMSGLLIPDSGEIEVLGYRLPHETYRVHRLLGIVQQTMALYENLTAWDNLAVYATISGIPRKKKQFHILNVLSQVQLLEHGHSRVFTFSSGMKRRLALGCALLADPPLIYLDEPTAGIDVQERFVLWDHIRALRTLNKTCVIATSSFAEACALCDRIALIVSGRLLTIDTPEQLMQCYGDIGIELQLAHPLTSLVELEAMRGIKKIVQQGAQLCITAVDSRQVLPQVIALVAREQEIKALRVRELRLDEILACLQTCC